MPLSEFPRPEESATGNEPPEIRVAPPGPMSIAAAGRLENVECPAFGRRRADRAEATGVDFAPIIFSSGRGANVFDADGNRYVDLAAGFGALLIGHNAPSVVRAMEAQADRLLLALGDVYSADAKIALLERLTSLHPGANAKGILCQSGSDAVTAALKTAMLATGKPGIVAFEGAYHGLGYGPLPACGVREALRRPFAEQLNPHVTFAPYPRTDAGTEQALSAVKLALSKGDVGAIVVEPILGRGGVVPAPASFLKGLSDLATTHGAITIADEIWTGLGRSGHMARSVAMGMSPDLLCFGKGLGGGLPISACVGHGDVMSAWAKHADVVHTSTHAGSPLACAAAIATLDSIRFRQLVTRSKTSGEAFLAALREHVSGAPGVVDVRGAGLLCGVELVDGSLAAQAARAMLGEGYIVVQGGIRGEALTLTPPLTIDPALLTLAAEALGRVARTLS